MDPLEVIAEYGADALRLSLVTGVAPGNDLRFSAEKVEAYRNFANKIWNASRFALMNLEDFEPQKDLAELELSLADQWILSRYSFAVTEVTRFLEKYDIGEGARVIYDFIWSELCDWYIEIIKPRLYGRYGEESRLAAQHVLWYVLKNTLQLLHPYMPFITEEIWQHLPHEGESIMVAAWPQPWQERDIEIEKTMGVVMNVITEIRTIRSEKQVQPGRRIKAIIQADAEKLALLKNAEDYIVSLAGLEELVIEAPGTKPEQSVSAVTDGIEIFLPLAGLVDLEEKKRLEKNRYCREGTSRPSEIG